MSKIAPAISSPPPMVWKNKGGRNATTNEAMSGSGMAPRPQNSKQPLLGSSAATGSGSSGIARVPGAGSSPSGYSGNAGSFLPVKTNAMANQTGNRIGQREVAPRGQSSRISPQTRTPVVGNEVATRKPNRKGGANFYGDL